MTFQEDIKMKIHEWVYKGIKHAGTAIVGALSAAALKKFHVQIAEEHQLALAVAISGGLGSILNMIKQRFPNLSWL